MFARKILGAVAVLALLGAPAMAQQHHKMKMKASGAMTAATMEADVAMEKMHKDMAITYTGNADVDFMKGMMPHHQGAIDMAKIVLKYGKDPEVKKLAEGIIAAQEAEIAQMKTWLAAHPK